MKNIFKIIRNVLLILFVIALVFIIPFSTIYRITGLKLSSSNLWINLFFSADFTKLIIYNIPQDQKKIIEDNIDFIREKEKINSFIQKNIVEKKFKPFLDNVIDYLFMKKNTKPLPVSLQREKNQLFYLLINLSNINLIPNQYHSTAQLNLKNLYSKYFPDILTFEKFLTPDLKRNLNQKRLDFNKIHKNIKYTIIIPLLVLFITILIAFRLKKIIAWLSVILIFSAILLFAFSLILFYGLNPSFYVYEQLKGILDFKAFFNDIVLPYSEFKKIFHNQLYKPIIIENISYFISGIFLLIYLILSKKRMDNKNNAIIEEIK